MITREWSIDDACRSKAERLQAIRRHLGLTQQEMAARLAGIGVKCSRGTLAKLESDGHQLTLPFALGYAELAGITVEQLVSPEPLVLTMLA